MSKIIRIATTVLMFIFIINAYSAKCTVSANDMNFGNYDSIISTPNDTISNISITCTKTRKNDNVQGFVDISPGTSTGGSCSSDRNLSNGSSNLKYEIYLSPSRSQKWCWNGSSGTGWNVFNFNNLNNPKSKTFNAYGRLFALQSSAIEGIYTQVLIASVEYA